MVFRGLNKINLDSKGRISIPSNYREILTKKVIKRLICTIDVDNCLLLYPYKNWEKIEKNILELPSLDRASRNLQRLLIGHAVEIEIDSSSRILIPRELRDFATLEKEAMFVGQGNKFELWNYKKWCSLRDEWLMSKEIKLPKEFNDLSI
ncbi:MAG: division/cell wall cluster transcriptional repressor MraZ [Gammaproteobacteria bacterium]|jgi:MraZ protein|nr:division/cell wall cluster transcriptional repressor MraZ [Gammaproteobacteria bacterium]MBT5216880.1 division/cell wall cluster transcriptional repressor MraZ [Gammaproteobacteria bacterium]MBT5541489.1 division/cell wall cluster transcriptional repressor MraZ [Gammaproteobacteria bacterium]MBT6074606.1 division/cell wall cluster transcriptional repressor MraZ [Gammaproteobacteria bacterium]MBT7753890.1 division/cell wall cluster transcriptional repressor MraZ [Gammaproteobacteria bacterium